ncbi:4-alpha-glucanotransferase [Chlamydiales bacterium STE3]|nr:4-alpha-glucanotransferase [Chlamydiales bacterium STE3]
MPSMANIPLLETICGANWQSVQIKNHHGIDTPLSSLRTRLSSGIGEYLDLLPLISWCSEIGFDVIQLLPINDTGLDLSPYNALSAKALHPIYISLYALPNLECYPELLSRLGEFQELNDTQRVDYLSVLNRKESFLRYYFDNEFDTAYSTDRYQNFLKENPWLLAYSLFKYFKTHYCWSSWQDWPKIDNNKHDFRNVHFHLFLQYLCFSQMEEVRKCAVQNNILLKGDIPILISPDSADVWYETHLFDLTHAAGAPPDFYNEEGQNWGFPLYNYKEHEKDGFRWWKERMSVASRLYHIYRIDHIVGFYRIWAVKRGKPAIEGEFIPKDLKDWLPQGEMLLKMMIKSAPAMLPIGEDLGVLSEEIRASMRKLGIPGTKVMRWERYWGKNDCFINPKDYEKTSMTTVSTHDSEPLNLWWKNSPKDAKDFAKFMKWEYSPILSREHHEAILKESHLSNSLFHINLLQEYLALFPEFSWPNPSDERINIPGIISDRNWTYRYKPYLEDIIQHEEFKQTMRKLIT